MLLREASMRRATALGLVGLMALGVGSMFLLYSPHGPVWGAEHLWDTHPDGVFCSALRV